MKKINNISFSDEEIKRLLLLLDKEIKAKTSELKAIDYQTFKNESNKKKHEILQIVHIELLQVIKGKLTQSNPLSGEKQ